MDLQKVQELSELMFTEDQIRIILTADGDINDFETAMLKGRLLSLYNIRKSIYQMAKNGSSPAQKEWLAIVREDEFKKRQQ